MKILSIFLSLMISFNLFASENGGKLLSQIVDDYQYSLTIEWDQKDKEAFQKINNDFRSKVESVIQKEGFSKQELSNFLESKITNKNILNGLQARINQMSQEPTPSEIFSLFQDTQSNLYSQGASWNGEVLTIAGITVFVIGFVALVVSAFVNAAKTCESEGGQSVTTQTNCGIRSVCVSGGENYCYEYQDQYKCDEVTECVH